MGTLCVSENESQLDNPEWETKGDNAEGKSKKRKIGLSFRVMTIGGEKINVKYVINLPLSWQFQLISGRR